MGNKIKLSDTSGHRFPKKPKPNEAEITSTDSFISITNPSTTSSISPGGVFFVSSGSSSGSIQYNVNGNFFGDPGFLRDSISGTTIMEQEQNNNVGVGLVLATADSQLLPFDFGGLIRSDGNNNLALNGVFDFSQNGGSLFTAGMLSQDSSLSSQTTFLITSEAFIMNSASDGNCTPAIQAAQYLSGGFMSIGVSDQESNYYQFGASIISGQTPNLIIQYFSTTWTWATQDGQNGDVLTTNGNGALSFSNLLRINNVPFYANDAAATASGLTTGNLYKTTTGGITALNIVP